MTPRSNHNRFGGKLPARLLAALLACLFAAGCSIKVQVDCHPDSSSFCRAACDAASIPLDATPIADRPPIELFELDNSVGGVPFSNADTTSVRVVNLAGCQSLAAANSATAQALQSHSRFLQRQECPPSCIINALNSQQSHERNLAAGRGSELFLNLVELHLQNELLANAVMDVERAGRILAKLQENDLARDFDQGNVDRQRLFIEEQRIQLTSRYLQASTGLESLLSIQTESMSPLWTDFQTTEPIDIPDVEQSIARALANRADLAALEEMYGCIDTLEIDALRGLSSGMSPLLGIGLTPKACLFKKLAKQRARDAESPSRREQICELIKLKRETIRNEVVQSLTQWREHEQLLELKRSTISSLEQSLARQEKLKDIETIRFDARVELEQQLQRERSNLVHELIAREISRIQFQQSLGQLDPVSAN